MLLKEIIKRINQNPDKQITFATYMELALYHPLYGYYSKNRQKIGKEGDFYTSSSVGPIFGVMWAKHFVNTWRELGLLDQSDLPLIMLEIGGGTGDFANSIIEEFHRTYPDVYERLQYYICEQSEYHRTLQLEKVAMYSEHVRIIKHLAHIHERSIHKPSIIFSNELFDALPVALIKKTNAGLFEGWVTIKDDQLVETWQPLNNEQLEQYILDMNITIPNGHILEISVAAKTIYDDISAAMEDGYVFTVDYGWTFAELLRPERRDGTLIGYDRHQHVTNVYERPGEIDITTHVHFDALMRWGEFHGFENVSYLTQREWLMKEGILQQLQEHQDPNPFGQIAKQNRAILQLISPGGMGDTFKVLTQRRVSQV